MKYYLASFVVLGSLVLASSAQAKSGGLGIGIEPVVGYERTQSLWPTQHTKDRLIYGARVTAGLIFFSAEAEYLKAHSTEDFPATLQSSDDTAEKYKLGIRSSIDLVPVISVILRAGGQATKATHIQTTNGVSTTVNDPMSYHPYGGAGVRVKIGPIFSLVGDVVAVINDINNMSSNEYQVTAGFSVHFP